MTNQSLPPTSENQAAARGRESPPDLIAFKWAECDALHLPVRRERFRLSSHSHLRRWSGGEPGQNGSESNARIRATVRLRAVAR